MQLEADWYDMVLATFYGWAIAVVVGMGTLGLFDVQLSDVLFNVGESEITYATLTTLVTLGIVYLTNDNEPGDWDAFYKLAIGITVFLTVAIPFVPAIEDLVTSSDLVRTVVVVVSSIAFAAVGYIK